MTLTGKEFPDIHFIFKPDVSSFIDYFSAKLSLEVLPSSQQTPLQNAINIVGEEMLVYNVKNTDSKLKNITSIQVAFKHLEEELTKVIYTNPE